MSSTELDRGEQHEVQVQRELDAQYASLKDQARSVFRAVQGRRGVRTEADWENIRRKAEAKYQSGQFLIEQLGAERYLEPEMMATLVGLRNSLLQECETGGAGRTMLADLAVLSYFNSLRLQTWIGNLSVLIERELFGQDPLRLLRGDATGSTIEDRLRRFGEQLLPLQDRANRMMVRNLRALDGLTRGPAPTVAVGRAEQVNIGQQQMNQVKPAAD